VEIIRRQSGLAFSSRTTDSFISRARIAWSAIDSRSRHTGLFISSPFRFLSQGRRNNRLVSAFAIDKAENFRFLSGISTRSGDDRREHRSIRHASQLLFTALWRQDTRRPRGYDVIPRIPIISALHADNDSVAKLGIPRVRSPAIQTVGNFWIPIWIPRLRPHDGVHSRSPLPETLRFSSQRDICAEPLDVQEARCVEDTLANSLRQSSR